MKITATIRKLVLHKGKANWGIAYEKYQEGKVPGRYFVHYTYLKNLEDQPKLQIGARVTFTPGPPRNKSELPIAKDIEVVNPGREALAGPVEGSETEAVR